MRRLSIGLLVATVILAGCRQEPLVAGDPGGTAAGEAETTAANEEGATPLATLADGPLRLELVADFNIRTGATFESISDADFGGISGLFFDPDRMEIVAVSDSRANNRYFTLEVDTGGESISFVPRSVRYLEDAPELDDAQSSASAPGISAARRVFDPESIARAPNGNLFVSTEGMVAREPRIAPVIAEYSPDGRFVRFLPVPDKFIPEAGGPQTKGIVNNLAFESLAVSPDGSRVFTATEAALVQDDSRAALDKGSRARLLEIGLDGDTFDEVKEYVYVVEPLTPPSDFDMTSGENGLVELLALSNTELLALERNFVRGGTREEPKRQNVIRLFRVSLGSATDVSTIFSLADLDPRSRGGIAPIKKELILDFDDILPALSREFPELDNFEGLSFGPVLPDGSPSLIVVSDNNFNPWQRTSFLLFRIRTD